MALAKRWQAKFMEDGSLLIEARMTASGASGSTLGDDEFPVVRQADLSAITYGVYNVTEDTALVAAGTALTISSVINNTLQTWTVDSYGFNFTTIVAASVFADAGGDHVSVEIKFTLSGGTIFFLAIEDPSVISLYST